MLENNRAAPQSEEDTAYPQIKCGGWSKGGSLLYCAGWRLFFCFPHRQQPNLLV